MALADWELSAAKLLQRMKRWKDFTLVQRLAAIGKQPYSDKFMAKIKQGRYIIPEKKRAKLMRSYAHAMKTYRPPVADVVEPLSPIGMVEQIFTEWYTVREWLERRGEDDPSLNIDFSEIRIADHGYQFVCERGDRRIFTTKKRSGSPPTDMKPGQLQALVYSVEVQTYDEIETWIQVSSGLFYGADPLGAKTIDNAAAEVELFQENNEKAGKNPGASRHAYTWWMHDARQSKYEFLGIGVNI